jgi:hypothetical protein
MYCKQTRLPICLASLLLVSCGQARDYATRPVEFGALGLQEPEHEESESYTNRDIGSSHGYDDTYTRLQLIREDIEFKDFDVDFDNGSDGTLLDFERGRGGFRAEFGQVADSSFFQVFSEKVKAPSLLAREFTNYGIGGGVIGSPIVGSSGDMEFLVPFKFEANVSYGSKNVGIYDQELWYAEGIFEVGFGARWLGLQSSAGVIVNSLVGLFDSDLPSSSALGSGTEISGSNLGAYFEVLYKHPNVPLMARVRAIAGDIQGVMLTFGFAL